MGDEEAAVTSENAASTHKGTDVAAWGPGSTSRGATPPPLPPADGLPGGSRLGGPAAVLSPRPRQHPGCHRDHLPKAGHRGRRAADFGAPALCPETSGTRGRPSAPVTQAARCGQALVHVSQGGGRQRCRHPHGGLPAC